jgi:hypothetical protein
MPCQQISIDQSDGDIIKPRLWHLMLELKPLMECRDGANSGSSNSSKIDGMSRILLESKPSPEVIQHNPDSSDITIESILIQTLQKSMECRE